MNKVIVTKRKSSGLILVVLLIFLSAGSNSLPKVLIIGDSISIGYTPFVKEYFRDKANIIHNPGNAGDTGRGLKNIKDWVGDEEWDIIQFNWGLWDLCYRHQDSRLYGNRA